MHTSSLIVYKNEQKDKKFKNLFCKEHLMTISMVAYLRKNYYFTEIVNEKIGLFHTAGLITVWDKRSSTIGGNVNIDETEDRKPISLENLKGIFMIYLFACLASCLLFTSEIAFHFLFTKLSGTIVSVKRSRSTHVKFSRKLYYH